jgi:hypothetical protein
MKTSPCADHECLDGSILERPRYFPRQLITPTDLTLEATYFRDKLRRHNRLLHGWGVVCGALVCPVRTSDGTGFEPWTVRVEPGYALGPCGDEILVDCARTVDLRGPGVSGACGDPAGDAPDPWCSQVFVKREPGPLYVAMKYKELMARPVRVQPAGCGCDDVQCEYSRWRDGYEIGILTACPPSHARDRASGAARLEDLIRGPIPACAPCPPDPWVVLARVDLDAGGVVTRIDNCSCRRMVMSFGRFWWHCTTDGPKISAVDPSEIDPAKTDKLTVHGENFKTGIQVAAGEGVTVGAPEQLTASSFVVACKVAADADGPRLLTVVNGECSIATWPITIKRAPAPMPAPRPTPAPAPMPAAESGGGIPPTVRSPEGGRQRRREAKP